MAIFESLTLLASKGRPPFRSIESKSVMAINLYPRGFLYTRESIHLAGDLDGFGSRTTNRGTFWLSRESAFEIIESQSTLIALIGHAQHVSEYAASGDTREICGQLLDVWSSNGAAGVEEYLYDLGGRYTLFILTDQHQLVYHDAHGMRSVYFAKDHGFVSSHERILADLIDATPCSITVSGLPLALRWRFSRFNGIQALQPNHRLDLGTGTQSRYFPFGENPYSRVPEKTRLEMAHRLWTEQIRLIADGKNVALSMTGGLDSRVSLAMSRNIWGEAQAFTYTAIPRKESAWSRSIYQDEAIVQQILDVVDIDHEFLRRHEAPQLTAAEKSTLAKNTAGQHGQWLLKLYQAAFPQSDTIHLRANLHETARNYFHKYRTPAEPLRGLRKLMRDQTLQKVPALEPRIDSVMREFEEQIQLAGYANLPAGYEPLDMYYWELRQGRWFSEVFNETDCAFETAIPFNHRRLIDIALSFDAKQRQNGYFFKELINRSAPFLNFYGVNTTKNLYEQARGVQRAKTKPIEAQNLLSRDVTIGAQIDVMDESGNLMATRPYEGILYLPAGQLKKNYSAELTVNVTPNLEKLPLDLYITVNNGYENAKATGYLEFVVSVDAVDVLRHDLATRAEPFGITLTALPTGTPVTIRIRSLRDIQRDSWASASRTGLRISARPSRQTARKVLTDNPDVQLFNPASVN